MQTDIFIKNQVANQYDNETITENKKDLDFSPFVAEMNRILEDRYREIFDMVSEKPVSEIQKHVSMGNLTYKELILYYINRIYRFENKKLNTIMELNPEALELAVEADKNRPENPNPLYGIPVLLKDNIATGDQLHNTAGAKILEDFIPVKMAPIVEKLKDLNGIVLGKTNMSEWAYYMSSDGVCGYSTLGGQTKNPYGRFEVGGSSSGSAASMAAGFAALAIGSETCGSIIYPAGQNGVVGLYPTKGTWSNENIIPISPSLDTAGPMTSNVEDAAVLMSALTDIEKLKSIDWNAVFKESVEGVTIGLVVNEEINKHGRKGDGEIIKRVTGELENIGFTVKKIKLDEKHNGIDIDSILEREFKDSIDEYISLNSVEGIRDISDIQSFYESNPTSYAPYGFDLVIKSASTSLDIEKVEDIEKNNRRIAQESLDDALKEVDVLMALSNLLSVVYTSAGYPSLIVPAGYRKDGEPVGLTFTAGEFHEEKLLLIGRRYEKATKHRRMPVQYSRDY